MFIAQRQRAWRAIRASRLTTVTILQDTADKLMSPIRLSPSFTLALAGVSFSWTVAA
jgi:hypothetical protein